MGTKSITCRLEELMHQRLTEAQYRFSFDKIIPKRSLKKDILCGVCILFDKLRKINAISLMLIQLSKIDFTPSKKCLRLIATIYAPIVTGLFMGIKGKSSSQWVHEILLVCLFPESLTFEVVFVNFSVS